MKMQLCSNCHIPMVGIMSFSKEKHERFCRCKKCYGETKHQKMKDNDLNFRDILHKEYQKDFR